LSKDVLVRKQSDHETHHPSPGKTLPPVPVPVSTHGSLLLVFALVEESALDHRQNGVSGCIDGTLVHYLRPNRHLRAMRVIQAQISKGHGTEGVGP
jgi:hypothetical protein